MGTSPDPSPRSNQPTDGALFALARLPYPGTSQDFVRENPKFGIKAIQVRIDAEYTKRKGALANGIAKGRFDLSGVEARSRLNRAREYIEVAEAVNRLQEGQRALAALEDALPAVADAISVG
jgi:hypothetical protein